MLPELIHGYEVIVITYCNMVYFNAFVCEECASIYTLGAKQYKWYVI